MRGRGQKGLVESSGDKIGSAQSNSGALAEATPRSSLFAPLEWVTPSAQQ